MICALQSKADIVNTTTAHFTIIVIFIPLEKLLISILNTNIVHKSLKSTNDVENIMCTEWYLTVY